MDRAQFFKATGLGALAVVLGQRLPAAQAEVIEETVAPTIEPMAFWGCASASMYPTFAWSITDHALAEQMQYTTGVAPYYSG